MLNTQSAAAILHCFHLNNTTICEFIAFIIQEPMFEHHSLVLDVIQYPTEILSALADHSTMHQPVLTWALNLVNTSHIKSIQNLANKSNGWHFTALHASVEQINDFFLEDMACQMQTIASGLWTTIIKFLSADLKQVKQRISQDSITESMDLNHDDTDEEDDEAQFWVRLDGDSEQPGDVNHDGSESDVASSWHQRPKNERHQAINTGELCKISGYITPVDVACKFPEGCIYYQHYHA
jgi:hypothetical protein